MSAAFRKLHRQTQGDYFALHYADDSGFKGSPYRVHPDRFALNLAPAIQKQAATYFAEKGIAWHQHANHGLSSQVCCLNFLMPLAQDPERLARLVGRALGIAPSVMLPMEQDEAGTDWFVAFEWIGQQDYLNEAGKNGSRTRGANATSADAAVRFQIDGRTEIALIEWKFTESYGSPIPPAGNETRSGRYRDLAFAPVGPIRADTGLALEDFYWEPFYQMLRQQILAMRMEAARELDAQRVRVIHISPSGNRALHKVTAPAMRKFGEDAFTVFRSLLVDPTAFVDWSIEGLFGPDVATGNSAWADYLQLRYPLLCGGTAA